MRKVYLNFYQIQDDNSIIIENGFSRVHNLCEEIKLISLNWSFPKSVIEEICNTIDGKYDIVYMTAWWWDTIFLMYQIAKKLPHITFIVGGPAAQWMHGRFDKSLIPELQNLKIVKDTLESIFPDTYKDKKWGLTIPEKFNKDSKFNFCIGASRGCYWKKCNFCDGYNYFTYEAPDLNYVHNLPKEIINNKMNVQYTVSEARPKDLESWIPAFNFSPNLYHMFFWRAESRYIDDLKRILDQCKYPENLSFFIGVEFLSNRMLSYINKGITTDDYIQTFNTLLKYKCNVLGTVILGWNNLIKEDIDEFNRCLDKVESYERMMIKIRRLKVSDYTAPRFGDSFDGCEKQDFPLFLPEITDRPELWKKSYMFQYILGEEQKKLNEDVIKMFHGRKFRIPILDEYSMSLLKNDVFAGKTILSRTMIGGKII